MLATLVEGDPKAPFSITTIGEGATSFPGFLHFTLDPYLILLAPTSGSLDQVIVTRDKTYPNRSVLSCHGWPKFVVSARLANYDCLGV